MALTTAQQIQQLYIGYLGRPAEAAGLRDWVNAVDSGRATLDSVRAEFVRQPEYQRMYGELTREQAVARIYENLFERYPSAAEIQHWVSGGGASVSADRLIATALEGAGAGDDQTIANKITLAQFYTDFSGNNYDANLGRAALAEVGSDSATVAEAEAIIRTDGAGLPSTAELVQQLYIGYLGRAADPGGLAHWVRILDDGAALLDDLRVAFVESDEYQMFFGGLSRADLVTTIYQNLFEREPDPGGFDHWVNGNGASVPADKLVAYFIEAAGISDAQVVNNKVGVAQLYTHYSNASYDMSSARSIIADVSDIESVRASETLIGTAAAFMNENNLSGTPWIGMQQFQPGVSEVVNVGGTAGKSDIYLFNHHNFDNGDVVRLTNFEAHLDQVFLNDSYTLLKNAAPGAGSANALEIFMQQVGLDVHLNVETAPAGASANPDNLVTIVIVGADVDDIFPA